MGIYDRDYYRSSLPRGGFGYFDAWSVTTWLIVINVAVFFVDEALLRATQGPPRRFDPDDDVEQVQPSPRRGGEGGREAAIVYDMGPLQRWGYFSTATAISRGQVWRF